MNVIKLGDITLNCPPTSRNYRLEHQIVAGREATALSGAPLSLGVIRKRIWTITFHPDDQYLDILALFDTETTFQDYDGSVYDVVITGEPGVTGYPVESMGMMTVNVREV
jgi:hypothetical protein